MNDDLSARQRAVSLRLGGRSVPEICRVLGRSEAWFHNWWRRYLEFGAEGLYELTRANHHVATRIPPELERALLSVRRRLEAPTGPGSRYRLTGASAILAELQALHVHPLPSLRTIDRVLQRNGITLPRLRRPRLLPRQVYPTPQADQSNELHEVDLVGPIYLKGRRQRYYIWVCKDAFDGAVCLRLAHSRRMDEVLAFLGECWKTLGRPRQIQFDNAREIVGWGRSARSLSRVIRLCLYFGIVALFIPPGEPQYHGSAENFNGSYVTVPSLSGRRPAAGSTAFNG
jgi:Homeodomain-like domain